MSKIILKILILIVFLTLAAALTSCAQIDLTGTIDTDFLVTYQGNAKFDLSEYSYSQQALAQDSLLKLSEYWTQIGYECDVSLQEKIYTVYFKKQEQCSGYEEAFETLFKMMTGEYSPFTSLAYEYQSYDNLSEYKISGSLDTRGIFDEEVLKNLNEEIKQQIADEMNSAELTVNFILPNHQSLKEIISHLDVFIVEINQNSLNEFEIQGTIYGPEIIDKNSETVKKYDYYSKLKYVLAFILIIIALLTVILMIRIKKHRAH